MKTTIFLIPVVGLILCAACSDLIDVDIPKNQLVAETVFSDSASAHAVALNVYARLETTIDPLLAINLNAYTDDLVYSGSSPGLLEFYQGRLTAVNSTNRNIWARLYACIYQCNDVLENMEINPVVFGKNASGLAGEMLFLRAYAYFLLVNLYGDVPLVDGTDVNKHARAGRIDAGAVYDQMIVDLTTATDQLPLAYPTAEKARATRWAALALLARISLYRERWKLAEAYASEVIESGNFSLLDGSAITEVFAEDNAEAIFQLATQQGYPTVSPQLLPTSATTVPQYFLSADLLIDMEADDLRRSNWVGEMTVTVEGEPTVYYFPRKYINTATNIVRSEYLNVLRLAELYLIRAEARAQLGNLVGGGNDVTKVRERAGVDVPMPEAASEMLAVIKRERRLELFMEGNHRFFDLKRWGMLDDEVGSMKPQWISGSALLPIPEEEIRYNRNMTQNPGY